MLMLILDNQALISNTLHFNTSHVNVNLEHLLIKCQIICYFNTSHVNVNPATAGLCSSAIAISIHLMLMLIAKA